jgi:hypothetical protein
MRRKKTKINKLRDEKGEITTTATKNPGNHQGLL